MPNDKTLPYENGEISFHNLRNDFQTQLPNDGGFVCFWLVCIVLNNDNRPEPKGTTGQPMVGF